MRRMIEGAWFPDVSREQISENTAIAANFHTPRYILGIDEGRLAAEPQSFHLYGCYACPFAHRAVLGRAILDVDLPMTLANPWLGGPDGWHFDEDPNAPIKGATTLWEIYRACDPKYSGKVTVPVLWDKTANAMASNNSGEILEALIRAFDSQNKLNITLDGPGLAERCDWINERINIDIYKIGFATSQEAYDDAYDTFAASLLELNALLEGQDYLWGDRLSLADLLLFPTAIRFDAGYQGAFHMHTLSWRQFPNLWRHMQLISKLPGVMETVSPQDYRIHYFDDSAFPLRHKMSDGHYVVPKTPEPFLLPVDLGMFRAR